jgi:uncharacterized membrane protein YkvI
MTPGKNFLCLVQVSTLYIGSVIGAGFASGQEIMQFFVLHGSKGLWGAALATIMLAYLGGITMFLAVKIRSGCYRDILSCLMAPAGRKIMDALSLIMLLGGLCAMMAGSAAVFEEHLGLPARAGSLSVALITALVILGGLEGVLTANTFLVPIKFTVVALISVAALWSSGVAPEEFVFSARAAGGITGNWILAGMLYVSYNMVAPLAVLSTLGRVVPLKTGVAGGVLGGLLLGAVMFLVILAELAYMPEAGYYQIPLLYLAESLNTGFCRAVGILIWLAILTTAIADAHGFASRLASARKTRYRIYGIGACLLVLPAASFGFSNMVRLLYPLFGYAGLLLTAILLSTPLVVLFARNK